MNKHAAFGPKTGGQSHVGSKLSQRPAQHGFRWFGFQPGRDRRQFTVGNIKANFQTSNSHVELPESSRRGKRDFKFAIHRQPFSKPAETLMQTDYFTNHDY